jgi:hypothetical protein
MLSTRRNLLLQMLSGGVALAVEPACASANDDRLACSLQTESTVGYDDFLRLTARIEAKQSCCIYYPLSWGYVWGLRLFLSDAGGKISEPQFHPNFEHPSPGMMARSENYRCLKSGEIAALEDKVLAKSIFPSRGRFGLQLGYVPEPVREDTHLSQTVVMEDGSILSPWYPVTVI